MRSVRLADSAGAVRLLGVVNSLDTPVCHVETRRREQLRGALAPDARVGRRQRATRRGTS
jgi:peroxiredoxin